MLGSEPLPVTSSIRNWAAGEGGCIAWSLGQALQLPKDVKYFFGGSDEALAVRLQWHTIMLTFIICFLTPYYVTQIFFVRLLILSKQVAQLAFIKEDRLKDVAKEADKERALKDVAKAMAKERDIAMENAKEWTRAIESARALAKQKVVETEVKLGGIELKMAKAESIN